MNKDHPNTDTTEIDENFDQDNDNITPRAGNWDSHKVFILVLFASSVPFSMLDMAPTILLIVLYAIYISLAVGIYKSQRMGKTGKSIYALCILFFIMAAHSSTGMSQLSDAIQSGNIEETRKILSDNLDQQVKNESALHYAVRLRQAEIVNLMLSMGRKPSEEQAGRTALNLALRQKSKAVIEAFKSNGVSDAEISNEQARIVQQDEADRRADELAAAAVAENQRLAAIADSLESQKYWPNYEEAQPICAMWSHIATSATFADEKGLSRNDIETMALNSKELLADSKVPELRHAVWYDKIAVEYVLVFYNNRYSSDIQTVKRTTSIDEIRASLYQNCLKTLKPV